MKGSGWMDKSIRVGILFSLSGTMEISERGQYQAALLAIEEVNRNGGVNGRKIRPFVADTASNPYIAAREAERLIVEHKVTAIIGLYTSASRKEVIPIIEKYHSVLFYPNGYEGEEQHPNIIYCGPLPTQNLIHFIPWMADHIGKNFYLIGSDYIYPHETNAHIRSLVKVYQGKVLGEDYTPLGKQKFEENVKKIQDLDPDIFFSTLVGSSAVAFYKQYYEAGIKKPIASLITAETEVAALDPKYTVGHYACFPYFDSIETSENQLFLKSFKDLYDTDIVSSVMENAYNSVYLLVEALRKCGNIDTASILKNVRGVQFRAPQGQITVDKDNQHLWLNSRIGQVNKDGKFDILWRSDRLIQPIPFARYIFFDQKNKDKSLDQLDEQLQVKRKHYQPLINELKKATQDATDPIVFFDNDGQLISILNGQSLLEKNSLFFPIGTSAWQMPMLRNSGIVHALTTNIPSFTIKEEHMDKHLNKWTTIGIPVKNKNERLIGCLGIFVSRKNQASIHLFVSFLSKIASGCVELLERSDQYLSTYEWLNYFSNVINEPLWIFRKNDIVFENHSAKQLRIEHQDFLLEFIKKTVSSITLDKARKVVQQNSSNEFFEINITKKGNDHFVSVKPSVNPSILKRADSNLIGKSKGFLKSLFFANIAAKTDTNVLLIGENGTGKETFARVIHNKSSRKGQPFIIFNCAALPSHLIQMELFG
ncbi:sigma-54-dependent Fis family transcriptional regulator [Bacillus sp. AFS076308]|nr:sigma-54-dependent Fis family transcriptional regulator [Bacillus sp. AFS076308]